MMDLLILGGTQFVGRALTQAALASGHQVTLFNRGNTNAQLFPEAEKLRGDRDGDLSALEGRTWDAVIDVNGYVPRIVEQTATLLQDAVKQYVFISTISVYDDDAIQENRGGDEDSPLATLEDETTEAITGETYGGLKVLCENVVQKHYPENNLIIRPGLIVGPTDHTDRFTFWPVQVARGQTVLAPPREAPVQVIDVRDLAAWTIRLVEKGINGIYNGVGPDYGLAYGRVLDACLAAAEAPVECVLHVDEAFLLAQGVQPWADLPLWLPDEAIGMAHISNARSIESGLRFRAIETTVADILTWYKATYGLDRDLKTGLDADKMAELVVAWQATQQ